MVTDRVEICLRPAEAEDLSQIVHLDRLAFAPLKSNAEVEQEWYAHGINPEGRQQFIAVDQRTGLGVGTYTELQLSVFLEGQELPAKGFAGVAVALERRGQGVGRWMLEQSLRDLQQQQIPLAILYPFQHGFYRQLGWAWVGRVHQYTVASHHLPSYPERCHIAAYDPTQHQIALTNAYHHAACQHNGWLRRQDWQWRSRLKPCPGREIYCYLEGGQILGYVILQYTLLDTLSQPALSLVIQEWVALNGDAYRGILGFLSTLKDQVSTLVWNTYPEDSFPYLLREQRCDPGLRQTVEFFGLTHRFGEIGAGFMWRLIDVATAFRLRPVRPGDSFLLTFEITDPVLGDQTLTANFATGRMHPVSQRSPGVLKTSIAHLTEMYCGLRRASELVWTKEVEWTGDPSLLTKLDTAWEATPPFCWDAF